MKLKELHNLGKTLLRSNNISNHDNIVKQLIQHYLDITDTQFVLRYNYDISVQIKHKVLSSIKDVINKKPLVYIVGSTNFYYSKILINKSVLIPRKETEELVENTLKIIFENFNANTPITAVDIGTGSGAIIVSLFKNLHSKINNFKAYATDISPLALELAQKNFKMNKCIVNAFQGDLLDPLISRKIKVNVLISNPPYISPNDKIDDSVYYNEPHLALFAKNFGYECYIRIFQKIYSIIEDKYLLAFEIGDQQEKFLYYLSKLIFPNSKILIKKDLQGRNRMLFIYN